MRGVTKLSNGYADTLDDRFYTMVPKAVFAGMAVSLASCGGDRLDEAETVLRREWWALYRNGIVPQKPPFPCPDPIGA